MAKMTIPFDVRGAAEVRTLIDLLAKYQDQLPEELRSSLRELADCESVDFTADDFQAWAGWGCREVETDFRSTQIMTVNRILRRVRWLDDEGRIREDYPDRFRLGAGGAVFVSWGYDV